MDFRLTYGDLDLCDYPCSLEFGMDLGAGQHNPTALALLLQDGEIELTDRLSNRTLTFNVIIEGSDLAEIADAEAALMAEANKPLNTLTYDPGDGFGVPTVYDTFRGQVVFVRDDNMETSNLRRFTVTVKALPAGRSVSKFTSVGVAPSGSTTTTLDTCGATTGWTATVDGVAGTVTTAAGPPTTVAVSSSVLPFGLHYLTLRKTFAATTSTTNLLMVDWKPAPSGSPLSATGDGVNLPKFAEAASPTSGYTRTWFRVVAPSLAVTTFQVRVFDPAGFTNLELRIDNVAVTNAVPIVGTNRQQTRSLTIPGSARTQGSLAVESATAALGDAIVYVYPADDSTTGYSPSMRQFRSAGNTVTGDATKVSGSTEPLTGSAVSFLVPIGLFPAGLYLLVGRLATSGGGTPVITYTGRTGVGVGFPLGTVSGTRTITTTSTYQNFALGRLQLPTIDLDPAAATAGVVMSLDISSSTTCVYDEFWLFNTTIGQLIMVDCGTGAGTLGGNSRRLFIEPATVSTPRPTVRVGHNADRSDSHHPSSALTSWQAPVFEPPQANALIVTPNATDAVVSLSGYARWDLSAGS